MKKIPYGISDFRKLRKDNCLYIDKTRYIELIESYDEPYIFFLRPRRFGKSLLMSLFNYYYDIASRDEFEMLFHDLYIGKQPTTLKNSYYVLEFNFSGINTSTREATLQGFTQKVIEGLTWFEHKYHLNLQYDKTGFPSEIFHAFLTKVRFAIDGTLYVLIDEYDHFANELLSFQTEMFEEAISKTGFVRKWYEVLKIGTGTGLVDKIFATGVSPITLDSLTSGFNIASDLTRDLNLNAMLGFSEHEVVTLLQNVLGNDADIAAILPELQTYYNGYRFSEEAQIRLFNPDMILYYLTNYSKYHKPPKDLIDTNITSDYAKMHQLFTLKYRERNYRILRDILEGTPQETLITRQFSLAKKFTSDDFRSLLFYLGFLTVEHAELSGVLLRVPNYVIQELYFTFFGELLEEEAQYELDAADIRQSIATIARTGEIADFLHLVETALEKLSFRDYIHFDEKYVKIIMLTYLMMSKVYYVKSEYEVPKGYIDIALLQRSGVEPKFEAMIEVKYLKKQEYNDPKKSDTLLQESIEAARGQLLQYHESDELRAKPHLKKWIVVFAANTCAYTEEVND